MLCCSLFSHRRVILIPFVSFSNGFDDQGYVKESSHRVRRGWIRLFPPPSLRNRLLSEIQVVVCLNLWGVFVLWHGEVHGEVHGEFHRNPDQEYFSEFEFRAGGATETGRPGIGRRAFAERGEIRRGVPVVRYLTSDCNPTSVRRQAEPIPAKLIFQLHASRRAA